jgi:hypothetical protein
VVVREVKEVPLRWRSGGEMLREEGKRLAATWLRAPVTAAPTVDGRLLDGQAFAARDVTGGGASRRAPVPARMDIPALGGGLDQDGDR